MRKKYFAVLVMAVILASMILITSCAQAQKEAVQNFTGTSPGGTLSQGAPAPSTEQRVSGAVADKAMTATSEAKPQVKDQLVIKTKQVQMEVTDVIKTKTKVELVVSQYKGYISNLTTSSDGIVTPEPSVKGAKDKITRATIETKIPAKQMDSFVKEIKKLGKLESEAEQAQNITLEYTDLSARLKNQKAAEERLLEMYNSAKTVEDMLKIEAQLTTVRGEIESLQGQINYYDQSVAMSTITIDIHEPSEITAPEWRKKFSDALNEAINNFMNVIVVLIGFSGVCLGLSIPLIFIALVIYLIAINITRRKKPVPKK